MIALTRHPSASMQACQLTYMERQEIDSNRAAAQHEAYCQTLEACGLEVVRLPAIDSLPDSVFVEDTTIVLDEVAVLTSMANEARREEVERIAPDVETYRRVARIQPPGQIDGGDVLRMGKRLFVGLSTRTNRAGIEGLQSIAAPYGYEVIAVPVLGCLHLKSGVTALDEETLLVNSSWIDTTPLDGFRFVEVAEDEPGGANVLHIGGQGLMSRVLISRVLISTVFPKTMERVAGKGFNVVPVDNSEFVKAEGGLTCCSLIFK